MNNFWAKRKQERNSAGEMDSISKSDKNYSQKQCEYCGLKLNKSCMANHYRRCKQLIKKKQDGLNPAKKESEGLPSDIVARIVTLGLSPAPEIVYFDSSANTSAHLKAKSLPRVTLQNTGKEISSGSVGEASTAAYVVCDNCRKVINVNRLEAHKKNCGAESTKKNTNRANSHQKSAPPKPQHFFQKRPFMVCYICGREFGSQSIAIHEPQCLQKVIDENSQLPKSQRRPLPKKHPEPSESSKWNPLDERKTIGGPSNFADHPDYDQGYSAYEQNLIPCKSCKRTFAPDRHRVHEPNCKAKPRLFPST